MGETKHEKAEVDALPDKRTAALLWFAVLAAPVAWTVGLNLDYALVRIACTERTMLPLHLVTLATLPVALAGAWVGWREWRRATARHPEARPGTELPRTPFMAAVGLFSSALFSLVIVAQWVTKLFLDPCMAI